MSRFLVTGGSGFIGTHIVQNLVDKGHQILNIDTVTPKVKAHDKFWEKLDICSADLDKHIAKYQPEYVIHLGARTDLNGKTLEDYAANIEGVSNLLNSLDKVQSVKQAVFASSMYVCHPGYVPKDENDFAPHTVYGESKVITERLIKDHNPQYTWSIIRPTSIWGPYFGEPYNLFFKIVMSGRYFHLGRRACIKTYGYVENAVVQIMSIFDFRQEVDKATFYIGDYEPYDISGWADEVGKFANVKIPTLPFFMFQLAAKFGDVLKYLGLNFPMTSFRLKNMTTNNIHDLTPIRRIVPILPISRIEGTKKTVEWLQNVESKSEILA